MADAVGATIAALALREGDQVRLVGLRGLPAARGAAVGDRPAVALMRPPPTSSGPAGALVLVGAAAIAGRYPDLPASTAGERTRRRPAAAGRRPHHRGDRPVLPRGARAWTPPSSTSSTSWPTPAPRPSSASRPPRWPARQTAAARVPRRGLDRAGQQPRLEVTIARVARLAVPTFADWCAIDVVRDGQRAPARRRPRRPAQGRARRRAAGALAPRPRQPDRGPGGGAHRPSPS